ncbi:alpha/beta hydrolase [Methylobacterium iners]|nr:alpha/beta fold hydrolase [Methylobacterium iners]
MPLVGRPARAGAAIAFGFTMTVCAALPVAATEEAVEVPGPLAALRGTLTRPGVASAAVLIIPGSGPTDRDGNNPLGVAASTYRLLAEGLAAKGVATLRIDKRGMIGSAAAVADPDAVTVSDYAGDVQHWADLLRAKTGAACVWLVGHSEGGLVALSTAQKAEGICGLILVATPGRPLGQVLRDQLTANPANAPLLAQAFGTIASLEGGRRVDDGALHPALASLFRPAVQGFLIDAFVLDPSKLLAAWQGPTLIVQGERDLQVSAADARGLHQAALRSELFLVPDANYVLKTVVSPDRAANIATYRDPRLPLAIGIVERIATFVTAPRAR